MALGIIVTTRETKSQTENKRSFEFPIVICITLDTYNALRNSHKTEYYLGLSRAYITLRHYPAVSINKYKYYDSNVGTNSYNNETYVI